jgi:hypothetical protein
VFEAIQTQFTWVIKRTLRLLVGTISLLFAGNFAGTAVHELGQGLVSGIDNLTNSEHGSETFTKERNTPLRCVPQL